MGWNTQTQKLPLGSSQLSAVDKHLSSLESLLGVQSLQKSDLRETGVPLAF